jgi:hypothetical protein
MALIGLVARGGHWSSDEALRLKKKAKLWSPCVVVALASAAMALPPAAAAKPVKSKIGAIALGFIHPNGVYEYIFGAAVGAHGEKRCLGGRKVSFFRDGPDGPDTLIGSDRTDFLGDAAFRWKQPPLSTITGDYYATVKQAVKHKGPGTRKCLADRSPRFSLTAPQFVP